MWLLVCVLCAFGAQSAWAQPTTAPIVEAIPGNTQVTVKWGAVTVPPGGGTMFYDVYLSTDSTSDGSIITSPSGTSASRTGLTNGTTYYFKVRARNSLGNGPLSTQVVVTPVAPPVVTEKSVDNNSVTIKWNSVDGASYYEVLRTIYNSTDPYAVVNTVYTTTGVSNYSFTDTNVVNGAYYNYRIRVANPDPNPNLVTFNILASPMATPAITAIAGKNEVTINYDTAGVNISPMQYQLFVSTDPAQIGAYSAASNSNVFNFTGNSSITLVNGTTYYFRIRPVSGWGTPSYSNQVACIPINGPVLEAPVLGSNSVSLKWSAVVPIPAPTTYTVYYEVYRASASGNYPLTPLVTTTGMTYTDATAANGTQYKYKIRTANPLPNSYLESASINATPMAQPELNVIPGIGQVSLTWGTIEGASSYRVYQSTVSGELGTVVANPTSSSSLRTGLTNGTTYYYTVQGRNATGSGVLSIQQMSKPLALPAAVNPVTLTPSNAQIQISFPAIANASEYRIYRSTTSNTYDYVSSPTLTATGIGTVVATDTGLTNGTIYYYVVRTVNTSGVSVSSTQVSATPIVTIVTAREDSYTVNEDSTLTVTASGVLGNDLSPNAHAITVLSNLEPDYGVLNIAVDGSFSYTPDEDFSGTDSFTYKVQDIVSHESDEATVTITVNPINDAPITYNSEISTIQNEPIGVYFDDFDADFDDLAYTLVTSPTHGTLSGTAPNLTYTPDVDYLGSDSFTFKVNDGEFSSNLGTVGITVGPVDSDTTPDFDALIRAGNSGSFIGNGIYNTTGAGQSLSHTFEVNESSSYQVQIQNEGSTSRSLTVKAPSSSDGWTLHYYDAATAGTEITSDITGTSGWSTPSIPASGSITIRVEIAPSEITTTPTRDVPITISSVGITITDTVVIRNYYNQPYRPDAIIETTADPIWESYDLGDDVYLPNGDNTGLPPTDPDYDAQTYRQSVSSGATAIYYIYGQNDGTLTDQLRLKAPAGNGGWTVRYFDEYYEGEEGIGEITADITDDGWTTPEMDTYYDWCVRVEVTPDNTVAFDSSFSIAVQVDSVGAGYLSDLRDVVTAVTTLTGETSQPEPTPGLTPTPSPNPVASNSTYKTLVDLAVSTPLKATDPNGDPLSYSIVTAPSHGTLSGTAPALIYTPDIAYSGTDSFIFKANDGVFDSNTATVAINVQSILLARDDAYTVNEDSTLQVYGVLENDIAPSEHGFYVLFNTSASHGSVYLDYDGYLTYYPDENFSGTDSFTYQIQDTTTNEVDEGTVTITINPVNDAPTATPDSFEVAEHAVLTGQLHGSDPDGDTLTFTGTWNTDENGHVDIAPDGTFSYTPRANSDYGGFYFEVSDGMETSSTIWVDVSILMVNDPPVASDSSVETVQNQAVPAPLSVYDSDSSLEYTIEIPPAHGTLSGSYPNKTYTPNADYVGSDSFTFKGHDGEFSSNLGTVSITVEPVDSDTNPDFDALIRAGNSGIFTGNGIYNTTGAGQSLSHTFEVNESASYQVQIENEGSTSRSLTVKAPSSSDGWTLHYYDAATAGTEITSDITGTSGWSTPSIPASGSITIRVEIAPTLTASYEKEVAIRLSGSGTSELDTVKVTGSFTQPYRPDAIIEVTADPIWESDYLGDDLYLPEGDDPGLSPTDPYYDAQTNRQAVGSGMTFKYYITAQNDGAFTDQLRLKAPAGSGGWTVRYFDGYEDTEITDAITGDGWTTPELESYYSYPIRVEVTPDSTVAFNSSFPVAVQVDSVGAGYLSDLRDVVTAITTLEHLADDLVIWPEEKLPIDSVGTGVLNNDGEDQSIGLSTFALHSTTFTVASKVSHVGGLFRFNAPAGDANWQIRYFYDEDQDGIADTGEEITTAITGTGWEHVVANEYIYGNYSLSGTEPVYDPIIVKVTPLTTVGVASEKAVLVTSTAVHETSSVDAVKAVITREKAVDVTIRPDYNSSDEYIGDRIYGTDGANQTVGYSQKEGTDLKAIFKIRVTNRGAVADTFKVKLPTAPTGWLLHCFSEGATEVDITDDETSSTGWTTSSIEPGAFVNLRLEVAPDPAVTGTVTASSLVTVTSVLDSTAVDAVKGTYGFQRIDKLQYSLDQGVTWIDAPSASGTEVIPAMARQVIGVRAVPLDPSLPWPYQPQVKPLWDHASYWNMGEAVWIRCGAASTTEQTISGECGNVVTTKMVVSESYRMSLRASKTYVAINGGTEGQVSLIAKVIRSDGTPAAGKTVRFTAKFIGTETDAGQIGSAGSSDDQAVTDSEGIATVTLHTGAEESYVDLQSFLVESGEDTLASRKQAVVFGLPTSESPEGETE